MRTPNEFWLCLHDLARAIDAEGRTNDERRANIMACLDAMPTIARNQVLSELGELLTFLPELYPHVVGGAREQHDGQGGRVA